MDVFDVAFVRRSFGSLEEDHPNRLEKVIMMVVGVFFLLDVMDIVVRKMVVLGNAVHRLALTVGTTVASILVFHVVIIFFGAPVLDLIKQTILLATLLGVVGVMPLASVLNTTNLEDYVDAILRLRQGMKWTKFLIILLRWRNQRERQATCSLIGTLLGAYLGALLLPLDWDRPWQQWPLPCIYGAVYGHIVGVIVATILNVQKQNKSPAATELATSSPRRRRTRINAEGEEDMIDNGRRKIRCFKANIIMRIL
ncbi:hypothetical protein THRCLA_20850 [Thraustotheca clavata]|uniref:Phosphatidylinositol-glycan biosynthesis class F protein n=1 Tax=Thraustotheca clavata TaxID=74557 RepID=A0A1W0A2T5_9STRA|nr:hypothetical protein THRCLA_20850 [Thraustotheca clavata]